ncbi:MAG: hypothetical protein KDC44_04245, partial [Phaeodactylibacter sp.]|nr:hypothetical protein [Phaeodactylibacter sp.]
MNAHLSKAHFLPLLFAVLFTGTLHSQNLVPNPSFENYTSCPNGSSQVYLLEDWYSPATSTPDYYNACYNGPPPGPDVPQNLLGYQYANSGNAYTGMLMHATGTIVREYIQTQLISPLEAGECYTVEMYTSFTFPGATLGKSNVGVYLTQTPPPIDPLAMIIGSPQVYYTEPVTDTMNWTVLKGTFTAVGGEQYITIGNFTPEGQFLIEPPGAVGLAYYYVDDVKVELTEGSSIDIEATICEGDCYQYEGQSFCTAGNY